MKTKHTAGPWESRPTAGHDKHGQSVVYAETDGRDIAIIYDGDANARLIAAAPDLLAACEKALEAFGPSSNSVVLVLQNAINKAKI